MLVPLTHLGDGKVFRVLIPPLNTLRQGNPGALSAGADLRE